MIPIEVVQRSLGAEMRITRRRLASGRRKNGTTLEMRVAKVIHRPTGKERVRTFRLPSLPIFAHPELQPHQLLLRQAEERRLLTGTDAISTLWLRCQGALIRKWCVWFLCTARAIPRHWTVEDTPGRASRKTLSYGCQALIKH